MPPSNAGQDRKLGSRRATLARELPTAIERGEVIPYYQPRIRTTDRRCVGAEALARWRSATLGNVPPDEFIPFAEEVEIINPLGLLMLGSACRDFASWTTGTRSEGDDWWLSVNASSLQFQDPAFPRQVADALVETGLTPGQLEIEITERLVVEGIGPCEETIHELRAMGVRFALDDFGAGFSALTCLVNLPLDVLKLDRAVIRDLDTNPDVLRLVRGTCALGHELGLRVVAEGVETMEQVDLLAEVGCDEAQGFGIAEPMPSDALVTYLGEDPAKRDD